MKVEKRILWIDVVRSIAICCVVMCHAVEGYMYTLDVNFMNAISAQSRCFAIIAFTFGRVGVPLFLMISGYLLLDKSYDESACIKFWKNKCFGLFIAIEVWIIVYNLFFIFYEGRELSLITLGKEMLLLKVSGMNHMWYMPMILGFYLTLPIIANALGTLGHKVIWIPYLILCLLF